MKQSPETLVQLLDKMHAAGENSAAVSVDDLTRQLGSRSFGTFLLIPGLITIAPLIGDIPGVPILMGSIVALAATQILMGKDSLVFPSWIMERSVDKNKLNSALSWFRKPARFSDRVVKPRWHIFTSFRARQSIAGVCLVVALLTPLMEVIPFSANIAGITWLAFGVSLVTCDGIWAAAALVFSSFGIGSMCYAFM